MKHVLIIAGTDSSGGAGLSRDVATASAFGLPVCPVVTAVTAQTDKALLSAVPMPCKLIREQIRSAFDSRHIGAVKIGMLGSTENVRLVTQELRDRHVPVVLDPVLRSTSGSSLLTGDAADTLMRELLPVADLVTPNRPELTALSRVPDADHARQVAALNAHAVLVKGGHDSGETCTDTLFDRQGIKHFSSPRLSRSKRGTGCTLATAIACGLAAGLGLREACAQAKKHLLAWLCEGETPSLPPELRT
ncbi:MAG: hydroxymethylpyrimidine/phosphomethylpyrimidine kinase [Rhodobacteraceae bacterium]|nr:hydroxymethylpyrimidine/phosphomethylpyrimidine kinase [Paracoccaceae bacterium]